MAVTTLYTMRPVLTASSDDVRASREPSTSAYSISGTEGFKTLHGKPTVSPSHHVDSTVFSTHICSTYTWRST